MADVGPVFERVCQEIDQVIPSLDEAIDIVSAAVLAEVAQAAVPSRSPARGQSPAPPKTRDQDPAFRMNLGRQTSRIQRVVRRG